MEKASRPKTSASEQPDRNVRRQRATAQNLAKGMTVEKAILDAGYMFRYCSLILVVLISLSYGCSSPPITQEKTIQELKAVVRTPNIQFNDARFYHESQKSLVSIRYRNSGQSHAYRVITDLKVFLDSHNVPINVPIEEDSIGFESTFAPRAARELRGILPDTFFEKVINGTEKLTMAFTAHYQDEQGKQFEAFSVWQFSKSRMEPILLKDRAN
jgi:hypothetical protein